MPPAPPDRRAGRRAGPPASARVPSPTAAGLPAHPPAASADRRRGRPDPCAAPPPALPRRRNSAPRPRTLRRRGTALPEPPGSAAGGLRGPGGSARRRRRFLKRWLAPREIPKRVKGEYRNNACFSVARARTVRPPRRERRWRDRAPPFEVPRAADKGDPDGEIEKYSMVNIAIIRWLL